MSSPKFKQPTFVKRHRKALQHPDPVFKWPPPLPTPRHLRHTGTRSASKQLCARAQYKDRTKPFTLLHLFNIFVLLSFFRTLRVSLNPSNSSPDRADNLSARRAVIYCESWIRAEPRELTGNTRLRWWAAVKDHICRIGGIPCCQR